MGYPASYNTDISVKPNGEEKNIHDVETNTPERILITYNGGDDYDGDDYVLTLFVRNIVKLKTEFTLYFLWIGIPVNIIKKKNPIIHSTI